MGGHDNPAWSPHADGARWLGPPDQPPHEALGSTNANEGASAPSSVSLPIRSRIQRPGGLAPPAPGPDGSEGLPEPLGAGFLGGAALAPFFVVVAWPQPLIPLQRPKAPRYPPHLSHATALFRALLFSLSLRLTQPPNTYLKTITTTTAQPRHSNAPRGNINPTLSSERAAHESTDAACARRSVDVDRASSRTYRNANADVSRH